MTNKLSINYISECTLGKGVLISSTQMTTTATSADDINIVQRAHTMFAATLGAQVHVSTQVCLCDSRVTNRRIRTGTVLLKVAMCLVFCCVVARGTAVVCIINIASSA